MDDQGQSKEAHGIYFKRVPEAEWKWFREFADKEFAGDYGMAFKWIVQGYMPPENTIIAEKLEEVLQKLKDFELRLMLLEGNQDNSAPGTRKMLSGRKIETKKVE